MPWRASSQLLATEGQICVERYYADLILFYVPNSHLLITPLRRVRVWDEAKSRYTTTSLHLTRGGVMKAVSSLNDGHDEAAPTDGDIDDRQS